VPCFGAQEILALSRRRPIEVAGVAFVLIVILSLLFAPVIWGKKTLLSSAHGTASILPTGAYLPHPTVWLSPPKTNDPGGVAWFPEPNYALIHDEVFHDHQVPLWNPYCGCGVPWLANMQSQVLNPLQALAWLVPPSPRAADLYLLVRLLVAGLLMFLFLRQLLSFVPSVCGAVAYMQTGYMIIYIGMPDVSVCAYIPGLFWASERLLRRPSLFNVCLLSVLSGLVVVGGMPEIAFLSFIFLAVYVMARLAALKSTQHENLSLLLMFGLSGILGAMLAAPQLFTFFEYMQQSFNSHDIDEASLPGIAYIPRFFVHLLNYFVPLIYGPLLQPGLRELTRYHGFVGYWGLIIAFMALLAVLTLISRFLRRRSDRLDIDVVAFVCLVGFLLLLAKRYAFPLIQWISTLPLLKLIVFWKYGEPLIAFFISTLAAIGLHWLGARSVTTKLVCAAFAVWTLGYALLLAFDSGEVLSHQYFYRLAAKSFALAVVPVILCFLSARQPGKFSRLAPYVVVCVCIELSCNFFIPTYYSLSKFAQATDNPYAGSPFIEKLKAIDTNYERVFAYDAVLYPDWAGAFRLLDIRDVDAMYPSRYFPFLRMFAYDSPTSNSLGETNLTTRFTGLEPALDFAASDSHSWRILRLWQLTSTSYILSTNSHLLASIAEPIQHGPVTLYRVQRVLPRAALFHHFDIADDGAAALRKIAAEDFDPFKSVVLERNELSPQLLQQLGRIANAPVVGTAEPAVIEKFTPQVVQIAVNINDPAVLLFNDTFFPGWDVYVDGEREPLLHANYLFRAALVSPGRHSVVFRYEPQSFQLGVIASAAALLALAVGLFWRRPNRTKIENSERSTPVNAS
jgi:hypothetical protein